MDGPALERVKLFISERGVHGTPLPSRAFRRYYWNRALRSVGIQANPHLARHWFVTNALRTIDQTSKDANEILRRKTELVQYMAWRTAELTLQAYEHVVRDDNFIATTLETIHRAMKPREQALRRDPGLLSESLKIELNASAEPHDEEWAILTGGQR
jgi:hypothetical protein